MNVVLVIPARFESTRFPGKPLAVISGLSMLRRCYLQCLKAFPADAIWVATDDSRIEEHCRSLGMRVLMTPNNCPTGTDRVYHLSKHVAADVYISVQGDEPVIDPGDIRTIARACEETPTAVINGMTAIVEPALFFDPHIPKLVCRPDGRLLYMSRGSIPTSKNLGFTRAWRQVCVYGIPRAALQIFAAHGGKTPLEEIEDIEILRFLELGYEVMMVPVSNSSISVDSPEDIALVEAAIAARGL